GECTLFALKSKSRCAGNHVQPVNSRQGTDDLFGDPVTEVLLIPPRAHVHEREHDNRSGPPALGQDSPRGRGASARGVRGIDASHILADIAGRPITWLRVVLESSLG